MTKQTFDLNFFKSRISRQCAIAAVFSFSCFIASNALATTLNQNVWTLSPSPSPNAAIENVPAGIWTDKNTSYYNLTGHYTGIGNLQTNESGTLRLQSSNISNITQQPVYNGNEGGIQTAFDGDFSNSQLNFQTWLSGTALGEPKTGYLFSPTTASVYGYFLNTSGWNQSTSGNDGRTGATAMRVVVQQAGQGDLSAYNASGFVYGSKPGATSFLANPAVTLFNGDVQAAKPNTNVTLSGNGVYLNPFEMHMEDNGSDVAGVGSVISMQRTNATGNLGVFWTGYLAQSFGTAPVDSLFAGVGPAKIGLDLTGTQYTANAAAITIKANDRIYLCASNTSTTHFSSNTELCKTWVNAAQDGSFDITVNGATKLTIDASGHVLMPQLPRSAANLPSGAIYADSTGVVHYVP